MTIPLEVRGLALRYGSRVVLSNVSFGVEAGRCLGVLGPNGAGKTTLLRALIGCLTPVVGDVRIQGLRPREALHTHDTAYFAGEATMPGFVRACRWGTLGTGGTVTRDRRRLRTLSRGTRQLLGLRTALGRHPLALIVLDEPWEGLDADGTRWLADILVKKRDQGAAIVLSSHRSDDFAGLCDAYLLLLPQQPMLLQAHQISPVGPVTPAVLTDVLERLRARGVPQPVQLRSALAPSVLDPPA